MLFYQTTLEIKTGKTMDFIDITDDVRFAVKDSGITFGWVLVQSLHTTGAILLNENEPLLLQKDLTRAMQRMYPIRPKSGPYQHDNFRIRTVNVCDDECRNGYAHLRAIHIGHEKSLVVAGGKISFGEWQRILFVECDRARSRKISILICGNKKAIGFRTRVHRFGKGKTAHRS